MYETRGMHIIRRKSDDKPLACLLTFSQEATEAILSVEGLTTDDAYVSCDIVRVEKITHHLAPAPSRRSSRPS